MRFSHVVIALGFALLIGCESGLDSSTFPKNNGFMMTDNLMCTIRKSSDRQDIGKKIALSGLTTSKPKARFDSDFTSPLRKVFEDQTTLSLLVVNSATGTIDAFVIDKKYGHFSRAVAVAFPEVFSQAHVGTCQ